jgi:hypothetical protein
LRLFILRSLLALALLATLTQTSFAAGGVRLQWTAPADDGLLGRAEQYDLRYSTQPITAANFTFLTSVPGLPPPAATGVIESFFVTGLQPNTNYYFAIKTADENGNWSPISNVLQSRSTVVDATIESYALSLSAPWPNPARSNTQLELTLPEAMPVRAEAFDIAGRKVRTLADGSMRSAGPGSLNWDLRDDQGRTLDAGVYLVRVAVGRDVMLRRIAVIR